MQKRQNKEFYLTPDQYERVVKIAKEFKKSTDEMIDEIEYWFIGYSSIDKILNDLEDPHKAIYAIYKLESSINN